MVALAAGSLDPAAARTTPTSAGFSSATSGSASSNRRRSSARSSSGCGPSGSPYVIRIPAPARASTRGISVLLWYAAVSSSGSTVTRAPGPNARMTCGRDGAA